MPGLIFLFYQRRDQPYIEFFVEPYCSLNSCGNYALFLVLASQSRYLFSIARLIVLFLGFKGISFSLLLALARLMAAMRCSCDCSSVQHLSSFWRFLHSECEFLLCMHASDDHSCSLL